MTEWGLRTRTLVSDNFAVAVAVAVVVAALGAGVVFTTNVDPGTTTEPVVQSSWQSTGGYDHEATVTEGNRVFPVGTTHEGRSTYYTRLSPELDGSFRYRFSGGDGSLDVAATTVLVMRSVGEGGEEFWRVEEPLAERTATLESGETLAVPFTVNVSSVLAELDAIESDLGASPGDTEVFVRTAVDANGTVAGESAEDAGQYDLQLDPGGDTYGVTGTGETRQHERTEPVTRAVQHSSVRSALGPLLLLFGLVSTGVLVAARADDRLEVPEGERAAAAFERERDEFDDWISRGSVSTDVTERDAVEIETLEELADVAIDVDSRVVEDVEDGTFYVLTDDVRYEYAPPPSVRR